MSIKSEEIHIFDEQVATEKVRNRLRMISWNDCDPVIEKRQIIYEDGVETGMRKNVGLKKADIELIISQHDKIENLYRDWRGKRNEVK